MKTLIKKSNFVRTNAIAGGVSLATVLGSSAATILTGDTTTAQNVIIPVAHGSNAAGTPDIALAWSSPTQKWDSYDNWDGRGETYQMENANAGTSYAIAFTPATTNVVLNGLDLDVWSGGGTFVVNWDVSGATSGSLGSGQVTTSGTGLNNVSFGGLTGAGSEVVTLTLTMDATSTGTGSYLAMDNLSFDQVAVPEPSSSLLAVAGLGAMAMRRRRK